MPQAPGLPLRPREEPFREFSVVFHDEIFAVQAFPGFFNDPVFSHTLGGVKDGFAINYGTGGIGSEILANRLGVGPVFACNDCKYEEAAQTLCQIGSAVFPEQPPGAHPVAIRRREHKHAVHG